MSFIKLTEQRASVVYVNPDHIVTMMQLDGETHLQIAGEQNIIVNETPDQVAELIATAFESDAPLGYNELSQLKELFEAYRAGRIQFAGSRL